MFIVSGQPLILVLGRYAKFTIIYRVSSLIIAIIFSRPSRIPPAAYAPTIARRISVVYPIRTPYGAKGRYSGREISDTVSNAASTAIWIGRE